MNEAQAQLILDLLEATRTTVARKNHEWMQNAAALATIYPQLDDFLYSLALLKQAEADEICSKLTDRIELVKLAIELMNLYPE